MTKKLLQLTFLLLLMPIFLFAQKDKPNYWTDQKASEVKSADNKPITAYRSLYLDTQAWEILLATAPTERSDLAKHKLKIKLPMPDGSMQLFSVVESPILEDKLATAFPEIKTYSAQGIDDPTAVARLDFSLKGFHAYIIGIKGTVYIDPDTPDQATQKYISYYKRNRYDTAKFQCEHSSDNIHESPNYAISRSGSMSGELRTYRLAISATGEYTSFHGGTKADAMSAIAVTVNRVNAIYERELAIRFVLVNNNQAIIFTNPNSDPFNNNSAGQMLSNNTSIINAAIGSSSYDIGHVFATGGSGLASLGVVCAFDKAEGATGITPPSGDLFYVDYVAHEIGHQFRANHTFNNCGFGESINAAYEPGSGSTIMAYTGICGINNVQESSDDYFHCISLQHITNFSNGRFCPTKMPTGNTAPTVSVGTSGFYIPISTPFELTASASDPDGDALTYCWEQFDLGPMSTLGSPTGTAPLFRSFAPTTNPTRSFPELGTIINNVNSSTEILPTSNRPLTFNATVRDNRAGGGAFAWNQITFNATTAAGPFEVTYPNDDTVTWDVGESVTITWDVANTNQAPVNCNTVDIFLSLNTGYSYPFTLATAVPNTGSATVAIPAGSATDYARIKIKAADNIFFDLNDDNFKIIDPTVSTQELGDFSQIKISPNPVQDNINIQFENNFQQAINIQIMTINGQVLLNQDKIIQQQNVVLDAQDLPAGLYLVKIIADDKLYTKKIIVQ